MLATVPASAGFGVAELQLDIDEAEHERRRAAGLGVATGYGFGGLNVLMALPTGFPSRSRPSPITNAPTSRGSRPESAPSPTARLSGTSRVPAGYGSPPYGP